VSARAAALALALSLAAAPRAAAPAPASGRTFQAGLSRAEVRLGEPFEWAVEVRHPAAETVALPAPAGLPGPPFHAEALGCARREAAAGEVVTRCAVRLTLLALGPHEVPPVALAVEAPGGREALAVPGSTVTGVGVLDPAVAPESVPLREPAPPVPLLVPTLRLVWWSLGLAAAAAAAALALRAWRRRRRRAAEPPPPPSPEETLARRLDELAALRLGARGEGRAHFVRLSEAVRAYLGAALAVPALDLTTAETLARLGAAGDPRVDLAALRAFLEEADLVKFARAAAPEARCEAGLAFARALLEALRPRPVDAAAPAAPPAAREGGAR
jgi:hypothetical protein